MRKPRRATPTCIWCADKLTEKKGGPKMIAGYPHCASCLPEGIFIYKEDEMYEGCFWIVHDRSGKDDGHSRITADAASFFPPAFDQRAKSAAFRSEKGEKIPCYQCTWCKKTIKQDCFVVRDKGVYCGDCVYPCSSGDCSLTIIAGIESECCNCERRLCPDHLDNIGDNGDQYCDDCIGDCSVEFECGTLIRDEDPPVKKQRTL